MNKDYSIPNSPEQTWEPILKCCATVCSLLLADLEFEEAARLRDALEAESGTTITPRRKGKRK